MEELNVKFFIFNYWSDLLLGSLETSFLEVGAYVSLKWATKGLQKGCFS